MDMETAKQLIEQYGYLAVFVSTVIEGEIVVLTAAALAAAGLLQPHLVITVSAAGAFVGHLLLFAVGRWKGMQLIEAFPLLRRHYPKANLIMDKYANWSVFICQYLYGMRLISAMLFGCSTITLIRFSLLQVVNCITWSILIYFAGHMIGVIAMQIFDTLGLYGLLAVVVGLAITLLFLYHRYGHHHVKAFLSSGRETGVEQNNATEGRHFILEQLEYHINLAARSEQPVTMFLLKMKPYKKKRHAKLLQWIAEELNQLLRLTDIPARFSEKSYAFIAPSTDATGAKQAIERLITKIRQDLPADAEMNNLRVGFCQWKKGMSAGKLLDNTFRNLAPIESL